MYTLIKFGGISMSEKMISNLKGQNVLVSYFNPENIELHFEVGILRIHNNECSWRVRNEHGIVASSNELLLEVESVGTCFTDDELHNLIERKHCEIDNVIGTCNKFLEDSLLESIEEDRYDVILNFSNSVKLEIFTTSKGTYKPYVIK